MFGRLHNLYSCGTESLFDDRDASFDSDRDLKLPMLLQFLNILNKLCCLYYQVQSQDEKSALKTDGAPAFIFFKPRSNSDQDKEKSISDEEMMKSAFGQGSNTAKKFNS